MSNDKELVGAFSFLMVIGGFLIIRGAMYPPSGLIMGVGLILIALVIGGAYLVRRRQNQPSKPHRP